MRMLLFGMDQEQPAQFAQALAEKGYQAVVCAAEERQISALRRAGLEAYLCVPAFPLSDGGGRCVDTEGRERIWFSSGCPCDEEAAERGLRRIAALARTAGIRGIYLDGARFASPASAEGEEAFFTCFCPHCRARAEKLGLDLEEGRRQLVALRQGKRTGFPPVLAAFRSQVIADYFTRFIETVHAAGPGLEANAFVFAPSLGWLVGQTGAAFAGVDVLSPMLYRAYPGSFGTACLNHEYGALLRLFGRESAERMAGMALPSNPLEAGFPPDALERETRAARALFSGRLEPIVQLADPLLRESVRAVARGGAQGCGLFAYASGGAQSLPEPRLLN